MKPYVHIACASVFAAAVLITSQARPQAPGTSPDGNAGGRVLPSIPVWPGTAPGSEAWTQKEVEYRNDWDHKQMVRNVTGPTLTAFLPEPSSATGAAVVVCPGGGFRFLSWESEGTQVAQWLQARGVAAFVLRYRLTETPASEEAFRKDLAAFFGRLASRSGRRADEPAKLEASKDQAKPSAGSRPASPESMQKIASLASADGRQAIKVVRQHAAEWGVKPDRVGIMGFSAGGMVTMGVVMEHDTESRPNFAAPIYGGGTNGAKVPDDAPPLLSYAPPMTSLPPPAAPGFIRSGRPPVNRSSCTSMRRAAMASACRPGASPSTTGSSGSATGSCKEGS
jgi:acetyl esterase/lipase